MVGRGRALLEGEWGAIGAVPERLQSGHRRCESGWGRRFLAVGNAVGAGVGVWECLWGRVSAVGRGDGDTPTPPSSDSLGRGWVEIDGMWTKSSLGSLTSLVVVSRCFKP